MSPDRSTAARAALGLLVAATAGLSASAAAQPPPAGSPVAAPPHAASGAHAPPHTPPRPAASAPPAGSAKAESPEEAQPPPAPGAENIGAPPANAITNNAVAQKGKIDVAGAGFAHLGLGLSYERPAGAIFGGAKVQLSTDWMLGLSAEWNPWFSIDTKQVRSGVVSAYATIIRRFQLRYEAVNLRTAASLGASRLMFDLYGARAGSIGPFVGISFLGIEWKLADRWYLVIDPSNIAFPVPHITGVPLGYLQYRATVGLDVQIF
jgi:hypothetical protein